MVGAPGAAVLRGEVGGGGTASVDGCLAASRVCGGGSPFPSASGCPFGLFGGNGQPCVHRVNTTPAAVHTCWTVLRSPYQHYPSLLSTPAPFLGLYWDGFHFFVQ